METLEEIRIGYHDSALTEDNGGSRGVAAGDRAPDALVVSLYDCETVRIHTLLQGVQWTLLAFAGIHPRNEDLQLLEAVRSRIVEQIFRQIKGFLVVPDVQELSGKPETILVDRELFAHEKFELTDPSLVLVRPDGYIGFRGRDRDGAHLEAYLDQFLLRGSQR